MPTFRGLFISLFFCAVFVSGLFVYLFFFLFVFILFESAVICLHLIQSCSKSSIRMFSCIASTPHQIYSNQLKNVREYEAGRFCFEVILWPKPRSSSLKVVLISRSGAYKHGRYEHIWLKSLRWCPVLRFLPRKTDRLTYLTDYAHSNVTHMDKQSPFLLRWMMTAKINVQMPLHTSL